MDAIAEAEVGTVPRVGHVIRQYLAASKRDRLLPDEKLSTLETMANDYLAARFKARPFDDIGAIDMQRAIDRAGSLGAEKAAVWLQQLFHDLDKYAVKEGLISAIRAKRLQAPIIDVKPSALGDGQFQKAWEAYSYCSNGGAVVDRGPCLAVLVSGVTLQPLGNVVRMRREDLDLDGRVWSWGEPRLHVHLSDAAIELIRKGIELSDFLHRETPSPFVFPSAGSKRDPFRVASYSGLYDLTRRLLGKRATPHDLRKTGLDAMKSLGGPEFWSLANEVSKGGTEGPPNVVHVALLDGWNSKIQEMTKPIWC